MADESRRWFGSVGGPVACRLATAGRGRDEEERFERGGGARGWLQEVQGNRVCKLGGGGTRATLAAPRAGETGRGGTAPGAAAAVRGAAAPCWRAGATTHSHSQHHPTQSQKGGTDAKM